MTAAIGPFNTVLIKNPMSILIMALLSILTVARAFIANLLKLGALRMAPLEAP